jgi:hypothetical protein
MIASARHMMSATAFGEFRVSGARRFSVRSYTRRPSLLSGFATIDFPADLAKLAHAIQKLGDLCRFAMRAAKKNVDRSLERNSFLSVQFRRGRAKLVEQIVDQLAGERFTLPSFYRSGERLKNFVHHVEHDLDRNALLS